jgi:tetratricopeptide (TPR) repeat protein
MLNTTTFQERLADLSNRTFIGRHLPLALFQVALFSPSSPFLILNAHGKVGMGKTMLVHELCHIALEHGAITAITDQHQLDILQVIRHLAEQLHIDLAESPHPAQPITTLSRRFLAELNELPHDKKVVIFFDEYHETAAFLDGWLRNLLMGEYGRFSSHVFFVIASRRALNRAWLSFGRAIQQIELRPFTQSEAQEFLNRANITDRERIAKMLARSQRIPGLLATMAAGSTNSLVKQGYQHFNQHAYPKALDEFNQAITLQPQNHYLYHWRGRTHWEAQDETAALADFSKAIDLRPDYINYYHWRGAAYRKTENFTAALADFSKAIELQPGNGDNYWARGYTHREAQNLPAAVSDFSKAIELQPQNINFYYWRGRAYLEMQDSDHAWQDFTHIKEILRQQKNKPSGLNGTTQ